MTSDQYTELVGFLGRKFDAIDRRFDAHDREFVEVRRHATVLFEQARDERRAMAEGAEVRFESLERKVASIDSRVGSVESALVSLDASVRGTLADHEARLRALE